MRIVIADDSGLLRAALTSLLTEAGHEVVGSASDGDQILALVDDLRPDVAILDIRMPPTFEHEGAQAAVALRAAHPELGILLLSQSLERRYVSGLVRDHPKGLGYLLKDRVVDVSVLLGALDTVAQGGTVLDPEVVTHLLGGGAVATQVARLSKREREVLDQMAQGGSNAAIADRLVIDIKTVETHIARIMTKLDLFPSPDDHRRVRAVLAWIQSAG